MPRSDSLKKEITISLITLFSFVQTSQRTSSYVDMIIDETLIFLDQNKNQLQLLRPSSKLTTTTPTTWILNENLVKRIKYVYYKPSVAQKCINLKGI